MRVDPEHVEVMSAPIRRHQQHTARVKFQGNYGFRMRHEVSYDWVVRFFIVLSVFFFIALGMYLIIESSRGILGLVFLQVSECGASLMTGSYYT